MNFCTSCGNELTEQATFCSNCGTKVTDSETATTTASVTKGETNHVSVTGDELKEKFSNTFSSAKTTVQNSQYFSYFTNTLKQPTSAIGSQSSAFGWINIVLLAAATTWAIYNILKGTIQVGMSEMGISSFFGLENSVYGAMRNELIPRFFVASLVVTLTFVAAAFLILKFTAKTNKNFNHMLSEFGGLLTPNIVLVLAAALFTTLFASPTNLLLALGALFFSFLLCFAAYNFYLYDRASINGLDNMYVLLISNVVVLVVLSILLYIQLEPMITFIDQIDSLMNNFNW